MYKPHTNFNVAESIQKKSEKAVFPFLKKFFLKLKEKNFRSDAKEVVGKVCQGCKCGEGGLFIFCYFYFFISMPC